MGLKFLVWLLPGILFWPEAGWSFVSDAGGIFPSSWIPAATAAAGSAVALWGMRRTIKSHLRKEREEIPQKNNSIAAEISRHFRQSRRAETST